MNSSSEMTYPEASVHYFKHMRACMYAVPSCFLLALQLHAFLVVNCGTDMRGGPSMYCAYEQFYTLICAKLSFISLSPPIYYMIVSRLECRHTYKNKNMPFNLHALLVSFRKSLNG